MGRSRLKKLKMTGLMTREDDPVCVGDPLALLDLSHQMTKNPASPFLERSVLYGCEFFSGGR